MVVVFTLSILFRKGIGSSLAVEFYVISLVPRRVVGIVSVWLLIADHNVFQECTVTLLVFHLFIPLGSFKLEMDYDFAFESGGRENTLPSSPVFVFVFFLNSHCHCLLGLLVYMFVSPSEL